MYLRMTFVAIFTIALILIPCGAALGKLGDNYHRKVAQLIPPSPSTVSDELTRLSKFNLNLIGNAESNLMNDWASSINNPAVIHANNVIGCVNTDRISNDELDEIIGIIRTDLVEKASLPVLSIFNSDDQDRMLTATVSAALVNLKSFCDGNINLYSPDYQQYTDLIEMYVGYLQGISEWETVILSASSYMEVRNNIISESKIGGSVNQSPNVDAKEMQLAIDELKSLNFESATDKSLRSLSNNIRKTDIELPDAVQKALYHLDDASTIKTTMKNVEALILNDSKPFDERIEQTIQILTPYLSEDELKSSSVMLSLAKYESGDLSLTELSSGIITIYNDKFSEDLALVLSTADQLSKASSSEGLDFSNLSSNFVVAASPAIKSLTKAAFQVEPSSDEDKLIDTAFAVGVSYFTGNPMIAISALQSTGTTVSVEQQRFQAIMSRLQVMDKKLNKLLEGQQEIIANLNSISEQLDIVTQQLTDVQSSLLTVEKNIIDEVHNEVRNLIARSPEMNKRRNCVNETGSLSRILIGDTSGDSIDRELKFFMGGNDSKWTLPSLTFNKEVVSNYQGQWSNWNNKCQEYLSQVYAGLLSEDDRGLFKFSNYRNSDFPIDGYSELREKFDYLNNEIDCNQANNSSPAFCNVTEELISRAEQKVISILSREEKVPRRIKELKSDLKFSYFVEKDEIYQGLRRSQWLLENRIGEFLDTVLLVQTSLMMLDSFEYARALNLPTEDVIHERLKEVKKYLFLSILQQEILAGSFYLDRLMRHYTTNKLTSLDYNVINTIPEIARGLGIRLINSCETGGKNSCLKEQQIAALNSERYDFPTLKNRFDHVFFDSERITFTKQNVVDVSTLGITVEDVESKLPPMALKSIHARAVVSIISELR